MSTVIALGIVGILGMSTLTSRAQSGHESSAESHPVIQNKVADIADDVKSIAGDVKNMMLLQREQTILLEEVRDDIAEVKEAQP